MKSLITRCCIALTLFTFASSCKPSRDRATTPPTATTAADDIMTVTTFPNAATVHTPPQLPALTTAELQDLTHALLAVPRMSVYLPSSCHDRAHALWMLLPETLRTKLGKTWVFSESAYTSVFRGGLVLAGTSMEPWRYHVTLTYRGPDNQLYALDPVRSDWPTPAPLAAWVADIRRTPGSLFPAVQISLDPALYLFYGHSMGAPANNPGAINTGEFYPYEGSAYSKAGIPRSLSRDDVATSVEAKRCSALTAAMEDPGRLQNLLDCARKENDEACAWPANDDEAKSALQQAVQGLTKSCPEVVDLYRARFDFWRARIQP